MKCLLRYFTLLAIGLVWICNLSLTQWVQTNCPYGGTINCFAVSGTNLFAGTYGGGVLGWRASPKEGKDAGFGFLYILYFGGIGSGIGLVTGAVIGHKENYVYPRWKLMKSQKNPDVIYMKDGTIIKGTIIAEIQEGDKLVQVTIRDLDGVLHNYDASFIERIEKGK
jgi:hypothetical protein